jgi:metal-responsive CopG/Arc/MetJ family transcriptional regulator
MSSVVHHGRKFNPDPPVPMALKLPESVWAAIDEVRGEQSRSVWIRDAVNAALKTEAAA